MPLEESTLVHNVFVYGTLKRGEPNHHILNESTDGTFEFVSEGKTKEKYPLVIASKYNIPFLLDKPGAENGQQIFGEIYRVDDPMLKNLDELENHPDFYVRRQDDVETLDGGHVTSCWIYFLPTFRPELLNLSTHSKYSSMGEHGLQYVPRYKRTVENYSPVKDVLHGISN